MSSSEGSDLWVLSLVLSWSWLLESSFPPVGKVTFVSYNKMTHDKGLNSHMKVS